MHALVFEAKIICVGYDFEDRGACQKKSSTIHAQGEMVNCYLIKLHCGKFSPHERDRTGNRVRASVVVLEGGRTDKLLEVLEVSLNLIKLLPRNIGLRTANHTR